MATCKCGFLKLGKPTGYPGVRVEMGCPLCKTTVKVAS